MFHLPASSCARRALPAVAAAALAGAASAQIVTFSVDWKSPTVGVPNAFSPAPITEGDVLSAATLVPAPGPLPPPGILESGGFMPVGGLNLALHAMCVGHPGGTPCKVEVDALSAGLDMRAMPPMGPVVMAPLYAFSVDRGPAGIPGSPVPPNVFSESPCGDAAADVFHDLGLPPGPLPPFAVPGAGNTGFVDGNGLPSCTGFVYPGLGLIEAPGLFAGDHIDALDLDVPDKYFPVTTATYFSLDSAFIDPMTGIPNTGSAIAHGFVGGDVLVTYPGPGLPVVYAPALLLGLDMFGPDSDDLDALALVENGVPGYQRSMGPYDWMTGATDMLLYSVRRGSAIIGKPDGIFGIPIEPGDILTTVGPIGTNPGIFIAAENLGLKTARSGMAAIGDDLTALDTLHAPATGMSYCFGDGSGMGCPCGNAGGTGRGCANSADPFGGLLWATGTPSLAADHVILTASGLTPGTSMLFFQGTVPFLGGIVFGDGLKCAGGAVIRLGPRAALNGNREFGYSVPGDPLVHVAGGIGAPGMYYYQVWYRDAAAFCTPATFNLTNGYKITWTP